MKYYIKVLAIILVFIGCNNEPKQPGTVAVDTTVMKRTPPPFQIVVKSEGMPMARALAIEPAPLETVIDYRQRTLADGKKVYDTVVRTKTLKTESVSYNYPVWNEVVKPFSTTTTPVPPPVPSTGYLLLQVSDKIELSGITGKVIENVRFENITGRAITLKNCTNITIRNCFFNKATEEGISAENCTGVIVEKNLFNGVASAFYALGGSSHTIRNNQNINSHVRPIGGRGNYVQLNGVGGTNIIENSVSVGFPGENQFEDHISCYKSSGVTVRGNILVGGGPSESGSGVMLGDYGGSNQLAENNIILSTGSVGMAIAGGSGITIRNNKIFGQRTAISNNPLYMWTQAGAACSGNTIVNNYVTWVDKNGSLNQGWNAGNCSSSTYDPSKNLPITLAGLGLPADWSALINFATVSDVLKIRGK